MQLRSEVICGVFENNLFIRECRINWDEIPDNSYIRDISAFNGIDNIRFNSPVTFFVGDNGSGKSTLLEAMAVNYGFNPEGGTRNYSFSTYDTHSELCDAIRLSKGLKLAEWGYFLRAESFYNVATAEEKYSRMGGVPQHLHQQSHGESFLTVAQENFRQNSVYFLDEPEAALSPQRQLTLLVEIAECVKQNSQFFIATHSPILLGIPDAEILCFDKGSISRCTYEETDSYQVTQMFINNRKHLLSKLLN